MAKVLLFLFCSLSSLLAYSADNYTIDPTHTWPSFEVDHLGYSKQYGRFNKTSGKITLDFESSAGSVEITIDANSLDMGFEQWDERMKGLEFFNVRNHPTIRYTSDKLIFEEDRVVGAEGYFTLLGTTRPLTLKVENFHCAKHLLTRKMHCGANISATIHRMQFGMAKFIPFISDEVRLFSPIEADIDQ